MRDHYKQRMTSAEAEVERLQKVVADQATEIKLLQGDKATWLDVFDTVRKECDPALLEESGGYVFRCVAKMREEAQTARLALDVALKEVERLKAQRDQATLLHEAAIEAQRAGGKTVVYKPHTRPTEFVFQDEPPPGAAT